MDQTEIQHQLSGLVNDWQIVLNESIDDKESYAFIAHKVVTIKTRAHTLRELLKNKLEEDAKSKFFYQKAYGCLERIGNFLQIKVKIKVDKKHIEELMKVMKAIEPEMKKLCEYVTT